MKHPLDPYEEMVRGALTFMIIAFMVAVFLILHGCVNAPVAPNLKLPDRKSTRLNSSHIPLSRMPSSA